MHRNYYYGSAAIIIIALLFSMLIAPDKNDVALMQLEDGNLQAAFEKYQREADKGNFSLDVAIPLSRLYLQYGDVDNAIMVMERFVLLYPDNIPARKHLGMLYKSAQRLEEYVQNLERIGELSPSEEVFRELVQVADFLCRDDIKQQALQHLIISVGYSPNEKDYTTLAYLYAKQGNNTAALKTLKSIIALQDYQVSPDTIEFALQLFMENKYIGKAFNIASIYLSKHTGGDEAARIMAIFRMQGRVDFALEFAKKLQSRMATSSAFQEEFVTDLLVRNKKKEALDILMMQLRKKHMPGGLPEMLIDLALGQENIPLLEELADTIPLNIIPEETLMHYTEIAFRKENAQMARKMIANLGERALATMPVLMVALQAAGNPSPIAFENLYKLSSNQLLNESQIVSLARIYAQRKQYLSLFELVEKLTVRQMLENVDAIEIAEMYLASGQAAAGIQRYAAAYREHLTRHDAPVMLQEMNTVLLFLAAGSGKNTLFSTQIEQLGGVSGSLLADCYSLAEKYHQSALLLSIAEMLYSYNATDANRMQLADTLLHNKHYDKALKLLAAMIEEGKPMERHYLDAVSKMISEHQTTLLSAHKPMLFRVIDHLLARADITEEEKRNSGYLLINAGYKEKAKSLFFILAQHQNAYSPDVQEVLFLAGEKPDNTILNWLKERAVSAEGAEQAVWLAHLNRLGQGRAVVAIVESQENKRQTAEVTDNYIQALIHTKSRKKLAEILKKELDKNTAADRYRKLVMLAISEGMDGIVEKPLQHLLTLFPGDAELLQQAGLYSFYQEHYTEAEKYFTNFLRLHEGNQEVYYAYAEILWSKHSYGKAKEYYQHAAELIGALSQKDFPTRMREAQIFYRQGNIKAASEMYKILLKEQPDNVNLKADFANMLIESRQFNEAKKLLIE